MDNLNQTLLKFFKDWLQAETKKIPQVEDTIKRLEGVISQIEDNQKKMGIIPSQTGKE